MNISILHQTVNKLIEPKKGILAADESIATANKRLESVSVVPTEEARRLYRELFFNTDGIEHYLNGVILFDETLHQTDFKGTPFHKVLIDKGILAGIKVDKSTTDLPGFPGEVITEGLDGLREQLQQYAKLGITFAKWRAVVSIDKQSNLPSDGAISANAHALARYAGLCQENDLVPIVEPEILLNGDHSQAECEQMLVKTLKILFEQLVLMRVDLSAVILKTSMSLPGANALSKATAPEVAESTVRALKASVPAELGGVVFLSGGQTSIEAAANLNAIAKLEPLPWEIAFSYARAIQSPALEVWQGKPENVEPAQREFVNWLKINTQADQGLLR